MGNLACLFLLTIFSTGGNAESETRQSDTDNNVKTTVHTLTMPGLETLPTLREEITSTEATLGDPSIGRGHSVADII